MATRFELVLFGEDAAQLRGVGEAVFAEVDRLEAQLSFYRPASELSDLNANAARLPVQLDPRFFSLLQRAAALSRAMQGAFDPTVGPLVRCWGFAGSGGRVPSNAAIAEALGRVGIDRLQFDEETCSVRFDRPGVTLDLGAIGKGYALERAADLLREYEVGAALIHAGTSSVYGLGAPPDNPAGWKIALRHPTRPAEHLTSILLRDRALGVSAPHGKFFTAEGERYGHVLDPRSGRPGRAALLAAVISESPTDADALSTALLTLGEPGLSQLQAGFPGTAALVVVEPAPGEIRSVAAGWEPAIGQRAG
jgi:thiamine biosynthesis lipoprotein